MKTYYVTVKEVWSQVVSIEAENEEKAVEKVIEGEGQYLEGMDENFQYSHTLEPNLWGVVEE